VRVMVGVAGVDAGSLVDWPMRACSVLGGGGEGMVGFVRFGG
jgi:hypothetical protein